ncbi:hypothetical protein [Vibrio mediterranei]|uniref:Toxin co-regulated pilus biosynthesis protein Q C-terminal domain-containing protein n=1 Tax=Vibrio mediterranei TaxID=689 RepID=A0ABX5DB95_9VIBR|nr:hypothetical protein [Vibrio mediterranei]PCD85619.1 hypothetical protein COR52_25660 [Vibrio mediterranei]PRQ66498.1 hypothetical protein COR51_16315 [Vibrio mediterranei]
MRTTILLLGLPLLLTGCTNPSYEGHGEYLELPQVNVIERDLSPFLTANINQNKASTPEVAVMPSSTKSASSGKRYIVRNGETYRDGLRRWLKSEGYDNIAWNLSDNAELALAQTAPHVFNRQGTLKTAITLLSGELETPIRLTVNHKAKVAGIYDFEDLPLITHVKGDSLKHVLREVVLHYGYRWVEGDDSARSYLAKRDYRFGADYYLLTTENDIDGALSTILDAYPVKAQILASTGQVFIVED